MPEIQQNGTNDVVIVGGGLAGIVAALQLRKRGINAQVYEQNQTMVEHEGMMLTLAPNACRTLEQADGNVLPKLISEGFLDCPWTIFRGNGVQAEKIHDDLQGRYGYPRLSILWKDALRILSEELPESCKHTGYRCYGVTQEEDGVVAHFLKGNEKIDVKAPLIIGADGIRSVVRSSVFGPIPLQDTGFLMWRALIDSNLLKKPLNEDDVVIIGYQADCDIYILDGPKGKLFWAFSVKGQEENRSSSGEEMKTKLLEHFKGWDLVTSIVEDTPPELIMERKVLDVPMLSKLHKGSVVLIGDAAHAVAPKLGQGTAMAFEDGLELALQLSSCSNIQTALEKYDARRLPRLQVVFEASRISPSRFKANQDFFDWLYGYDQFTAVA